MMIEPLLIYSGSHTHLWTNPDIASLASFEDDSDYDMDVHRIWIKDKKGEDLLVMIAKSELLNTLWDTAVEENNFKLDETTVQNCVDEILSQLDVVLIEDVWAPGGEQFCLTTAGKQIGKLYKKRIGIAFSPDCCIHIDNQEWSYST